MITYHDVDDLTVGSVPGVTKGLSTFNVTTGVTTNNGDVLLDVGGSLDIEQQVATGTANVRLIAHGDIGQSPTGIILANQLGVRQEGPSGNVLLDDENAVNIFAAANLAPTGMVTYHDVDDLTVGTVAGVTKGLRTFTATSGIQTNNGDVLLDVGNRVTNLNGGLVIAGPIVTGPGPAATTGDVRLIVRGDLSQTAPITADLLGIRQQNATLGNVLLDGPNAVNELAATNLWLTGMITYHDVDDLTVGSVPGVTKGLSTFNVTTGVTTNNGDVLLDVGGSLDIEQQVATGTANVRLIAHGDIGQSPTGIILANQLGVRQEGPSGNVLLDDENAVNIFAAANLAPTGMVTYHDVDDLTVGTVAGVTKGLRTFTATSGIQTNNGDVLLDVGNRVTNLNGGLVIAGPIVTGPGPAATTGDVRLIVRGDLSQTAPITADLLGIRQQNATLGNVLLDGPNAVNELAATNLWLTGMITYHDVDDLTVGSVPGVTKGLSTFNVTTGVTTNNGDVLLDVGGSLDIEQQVATGTANVRLIAHGDIGQSPTGIILANQLGVRQEGPSGNVLLDDENAVNIFAAANLAPTGMVTYHDVDDLTVGTVPGVTKGLRTFNVTTGVHDQQRGRVVGCRW